MIADFAPIIIMGLLVAAVGFYFIHRERKHEHSAHKTRRSG